MLDVALQFLTGQVTSHITARTGTDTVVVKPSQLVDEAGKYNFALDTIGASIINIEEERTFKSQLPDYIYADGRQAMLEPGLHLNLYVMFSAHFKNYDVALKYLSVVMTYFQAHPCFSSAEFPGLDPRIGKLSLEFQSLTYEQSNQIWAFIGGKQLPSVVYKVRMVVIQEEMRMTTAPPVTTVKTDIRSR